LYLQDQIALLAGVAVLFAFLTWLRWGAELLGLLREWIKEKEKQPVLSIEYDQNENPATFAPELNLIGQDGRPFCVQKYIKVLVRNRGGVAHALTLLNCFFNRELRSSS
jgi:hypothetical protein